MSGDIFCGTVISEDKRKRVDKDGYIVIENWATVEIGGRYEEVKEPELTLPLVDKKGEIICHIENPFYRKFQKMKRSPFIENFKK